MERKQTSMLEALKTLRNELMEQTAFQDTADRISLMQAFDRLYMGYQNGSISFESVEDGISEIRRSFQTSARKAESLRPHISLRRDEVLGRNYRELAERMLSEERGTWDSRHVEIVQGAISQLAHMGSDTRSLAEGLQERMSTSVWFGNLELAETLSDMAEASRTIETSLLEMLDQRSASFESTTQDVADQEMALATEPELKRAIHHVVRQSNLNTLQAQDAISSSELKVSKAYVENLAQQVAKQQQDKVQAEAVQRAMASVKTASEKLIAEESQRLSELYNAAIAAARTQITSEDASKLASIADSALDAKGSVHDVAAQASQIAQVLKAIASHVPQVSDMVRAIEKAQWRIRTLGEISKENQSRVEPKPVDASQLLDARMMYEQKRMQFEMSQSYQNQPSDMYKALDFEVKAPVFENTKSHAAIAQAQNTIQRVRQLAQSAAAGDVGFYAPSAGSEHNANAYTALNLADNATPNVSAIPTLQSDLAKRSNKLLHDIKQLAFMPSVRADMGFVAPRYEMDDASQAPLFKRVRFNKDNKQANEFLPALYRVAGIKLKTQGSTPLRKKFGDLNLRGANLELIKIIENQFDNSVSGRATDQVQGLATEASQIKPKSQDSRSRVAAIIGDWVENRHSDKHAKSDPKSLIETGRMSRASIESSLKSEAIRLPASVQEKLSPFLGFDLSNVKIYTGSIAAMASEAMGAHAFTLGQNIFLGKDKLDFNSAEGLGLLAHELMHTSHFNSGDSVDAKEQAAESLEERVKQAFGNNNSSMSFALESSKDKKASTQANTSSSATGTIPAGTVGSSPVYDTDFIFDTVCEKVFEMMMEDFRKVKERNSD